MSEEVVIPDLPEGFQMDSLQGDNWHNFLNEHETFKDSDVAKNTKSPYDAIEQLINANKLIGTDRLPQPKEDWTEDQWNDFYAKLGRPEAADKYKYENAPEIEGFELSEDFMKDANEALFKAGLTPSQHTAVMDTFFNWLKNATDSSTQAATLSREQTEEALKKQYGADKWEGKVAEANAVIAQLGDQEFAKYLEESGLGNHPSMIKFMMNVAEQFSDDSAIGESIKSNLSGENQAKKRITELKADENFQKKLFNESAVGHKEAVAEWHDLHKKAYPGNQGQ